MTDQRDAAGVPAVDSPADWDRCLNTTDEPEQLLAHLDPAQSPLHARRYLQTVVAMGHKPTTLAALKRLEDLNGQGYEGARLRALATLYSYEEVLVAPPLYPASTDPNELENVLEYEMALSDACSYAGKRDQALSHVHGAQLLASSLQMTFRMQWLRIEQGRLLTLAGHPASGQIRAALTLIPMTRRRQEWGRETLAESYMAEGEFQRAYDLLDDDRGPLWHFVATLLNRRESLATLPGQEGHYADLARANWSVRDREDYVLTAGYAYYPQKGYAQVLRARAMISNPALKAQSVSALSTMNVQDLTQDQRAYLALMKLGACAENADVLVSQVAIRELRMALDALTTKEYIIPMMHGMSPNRSALASLVPGAHHEMTLRLTDLPILVGEHVNFRGQAVKLPGKASGGISMVRSAFNGQPVTMHHEAARRMRCTLEQQGITAELVNVGYILRCLRRLRDAALPDQRAPWQTAIENTLSLVDSRALQSDLRRELTPL